MKFDIETTIDGAKYRVFQREEDSVINIENVTDEKENDWIVISVKEQYREQRKKLFVSGKGWTGFNP